MKVIKHNIQPKNLLKLNTQELTIIPRSKLQTPRKKRGKKKQLELFLKKFK